MSKKFLVLLLFLFLFSGCGNDTEDRVNEMRAQNYLDPNICSLEGIDGESDTFYKYNFLTESEARNPQSYSQVRTCRSGHLTGSDQYKYWWYSVKPGYYKRDVYGQIVDEDYIYSNRIDCMGTDCSFYDGNIYENFTLDEFEKKDYNNIQIYKNGVLEREEKVSLSDVTLNVHKIKKFHNVEQAKSFIENSYNMMNKFNIKKELFIQNGKTKVRITIDSDKNLNDIVLYQVFSKNLLESFDNLDIEKNSNLIILDKDPVIGWYFNNTGDKRVVEYEIPGNNEGGNIIITQEPILFNEGELIVNYREIQCNTGEVELFELDDLEDSNIYSPGSNKLYKVCLGHIDLDLTKTKSQNFLHIFNYSDEGNFSLVNFDNEVFVSVDNKNVYWDIRFQENNPDGTYSCLGSYNNLVSSKFGDCEFSKNRIWIHLGQDFIPPVSTLSYPYNSHTIRINLSANDGLYGSGINEINYCIGFDCSDFKLYVEPFLISCEDNLGCSKLIKYYSIDNENNVEEIKEEYVTLLEQGSACQSDCTGKPTPNRIVKNCLGLNGCQFYGDTKEEQKTVANLCHYMTANTWVIYNETHEILCPSGPSRPTQFSQSSVNLWNSDCDSLQEVSYPVIIDGKQVNMKFVYCEEY